LPEIEKTGNRNSTIDRRRQKEAKERQSQQPQTNTLNDLKKQRSKLLQQQLLERAAAGRTQSNGLRNGNISNSGISDTDIRVSLDNGAMYGHLNDVTQIVEDTSTVVPSLTVAEIYGNEPSTRNGGSRVASSAARGSHQQAGRQQAEDKCCIVA